MKRLLLGSLLFYVANISTAIMGILSLGQNHLDLSQEQTDIKKASD